MSTSNDDEHDPRPLGLAHEITEEWLTSEPRSLGSLADEISKEWLTSGPQYYGLRERIDRLRSQRTLTSVASASVAAFSPDQTEAVKAFQESLGQVDKGMVFLLDRGAMKPTEVGIETTLNAESQKVLINARRGDIELSEAHDREMQLARIAARGPVWVEVVKFGAAILATFLLTYFGVK